MTRACPAWKFGAETHAVTLQRLENGALCSTGRFSKAHTDWPFARLSYVYEYTTELYRQQAKVY
jgi:hypothetical protein